MRQGLRFLRAATTPADRTVLVLAWVGLAALAATTYSAEPGRRAEIVVAGEVVERVPLAGERTVTVTGTQGPATLRVDHGGIRFRHSPCSAKRCLRAGRQSRAGDTAACVPNEVLVRVTGRPEGSWDAVNY
jgi:hypothetical protein